MPNQFGLDVFDLEDALFEQKDYMCSADLKDFIDENHLDLSLDGSFDPRSAFGSHEDSDHVYNTPRAWYGLRYFNPHTEKWEGEDASYTPESDDLPWCMVPEKKITVEDVKYVLSSHFQGTPYDPYAKHSDSVYRNKYRAIGINRTDLLSLIQIRPYMPEEFQVVQWIAFASNAFNVLVPFYPQVSKTPEYLANTTKEVSTENFYWSSRLLAAMADAAYAKTSIYIERYRLAVGSKAHELISKGDKAQKAAASPEEREKIRETINEEMATMLKKETAGTLDKVLFELSSSMKNAFSRSDA